VLADRIDCRSRQAARGPSRPGTKSLRITREGLAPLRESARGVKERRKPDRRWQNREIGGGLPPNQKDRESDLLGSTCRGKALWVGKVVLIDEGAAEAILVLRERRPGNTGRHRGARQGASEVVSPALSMAENARPGWHRPKRRRSETWSRKAQRGREREAEAGGAPSSACPAGVGLPQGGPTSHGRTGPSRVRQALCDQRSASCAPGSRTVHGCSCRESVADVGEKHLLRATKGSREASRGCTE
jgi:hypothetical protein